MTYEEYQDSVQEMQSFPEGKIFRLSYDATVEMMRITSRRKDSFDELREAFSVENKSAFFSQQYGYKGIPRFYSINQFGYFEGGLIGKISEWLRNQYGNLNCVAISRKCAQYVRNILRPLHGVICDITPETATILNIADDSGINAKRQDCMFEYRPYQRETIRNVIYRQFGRGLFEIPTAGGKSFIISNLIWNMNMLLGRNLKTMILVPNVQLVEQFCKDMVEYGYDRGAIAKFEGGMTKREKAENDIQNANVIIANRQFVYKNEKLLPKIDMLICDEVHTCVGDRTQQLIKKLNPLYRFGCSGTLPSDKYQLNQLVGAFGDIAYRETITNLQAAGFISKLKITLLDICDRNVEGNRELLFHLRSTRKFNQETQFEEDGIKFDDAIKAEHEYFAKWYKELYAPVLEYVSKLDGNTLVLFDKLDIGKSLYEHYANIYGNERCFYNDGSTAVDEREQTRLGLERSDSNVLFANVQIMSTGVSIKRLHNIVFCFSSKSTTRVVQSIGRTLRLFGDKEYANLIDVRFNCKYSDRHYSERLKLYQELYNKRKPDAILKFFV